VKAYWDETIEIKERERKASEWEGRPFNPKAAHGFSLPRNVAKTISIEKVERRNPGRADGVTWNADHYICGGQIEGDSYTGEELEPEDLDYQESEGTRRPMNSISLADMVRPGKTKRIKPRGFEVIPTISRVIVADDGASTTYSGWEDEFEYFEDDEWENWEHLYSSSSGSASEADVGEQVSVPVQKTYAQILVTQ